jgi:hypothetical protein
MPVVYYYLFINDKPRRSKTGLFRDANDVDEHLGRISATLIPAPHTINKLVKYICEKEDVDGSATCEVCVSWTDTVEQNDDPVRFMDEDCNGSTISKAFNIMISYTTSETTSTGLHHVAEVELPFGEQIQAKKDCGRCI